MMMMIMITIPKMMMNMEPRMEMGEKMRQEVMVITKM